MRATRWGLRVSVVMGAAAGLFLTSMPAALSQTTTTVTALGGQGIATPQRPTRTAYSVTEVSTQIQTLADGSQIRTRTETHRMVNSDGLQRTETTTDNWNMNQEPMAAHRR